MYYLVEFEPNGYILASLFKAFDISCFRPYPSPFALAGTEKENRFVANYYKCASFVDGELTVIDDILFDSVLVQPETYSRRKTVYDFEKHKWTTKNQ